jgi:hypothetical protein
VSFLGVEGAGRRASAAPMTKARRGNMSLRTAFLPTSLFFILILLDSLAVIEFIVP